ncbi:MAG: VCBS repeat-containing protein [Pseudomonadota bacterium]
MQAPRHLLRPWPGSARGGLLALCLWLAGTSGTAQAGGVVSAEYADPTDRYAHGILGDAIEWGTLIAIDGAGAPVRFTLPQDHVFEDVAPRLTDVDGDGDMEVIVVETDVTAGGALAVYDTTGKVTETPHIGTRNRWLAPVGAADLDGDGTVEIAYVDRPHLAKTLRIWRFANGTLTEVAALPGLTNHRIGERDIAGGIRTCGNGPEMILATGNWAELVAVSWGGGGFGWTSLGTDTTRPAFGAAMACE